MIFSPLFVLITVVIFTTSGKPILFRQIRTGKDNLPFSIIKFRTMTVNTTENLSDMERLTKVGATLRKTSLDELPQLINILKGEMSFIGPRPLLTDYIASYTSREILRHNIRPGMSSYAGVNGRGKLTWEEQFEMDVYYVEHISFLLDLKIFLRTIPKVIGSDGATIVGRNNPGRFDDYRKKQLAQNRLLDYSINDSLDLTKKV